VDAFMSTGGRRDSNKCTPRGPKLSFALDQHCCRLNSVLDPFGLDALGWVADIRTTGEFLYYGSAAVRNTG
jgi:hypothetical protein